MASDLDTVATDYEGRVELERVDVADDPDRAMELGARSTPTLIAMTGGEETARLIGRRSRHELDQLFGAAAAGTSSTVGRVDPVLSAAAGAVLAGFAVPTSSVELGVGGSLVMLMGGIQWMRRRRT